MNIRRSLRALLGRAETDRPYFVQADWLWDPIPPDPVLDPDSAAIAAALGTGVQVANLDAFATTLCTVGRSSDVLRHAVRFTYTGEWGDDPFGNRRPPIPIDTPLPTGSDKHLAVLDEATGMTFNLWMAEPTSKGWRPVGVPWPRSTATAARPWAARRPGRGWPGSARSCGRRRSPTARSRTRCSSPPTWRRGLCCATRR